MADETMAAAYRTVLPSCACFDARVDGELHEGTQIYVGASISMGEQIAGHLMMMGVCPTAMPAMLVLALSAAATHMSMSRVREETPEIALDLMPEIRRVLERVAELIPTELARAEAFALEMSKTQGVAGTC